MILTETIELNGKQFKRTYSDTYKIKKIGTDEVYDEAVDILSANYEYEETDQALSQEEANDSEILDILLNG